MIKNFQQVEADMIANALAASPTANVTRGTMFRDLIIGVPAFEMSQLYGQVNVAQLAQSIANATGSHLDRLLNNYGLFRRAGVEATGSIVFRRSTIPVTDIEIPIGTRISTEPTTTNDPVTFVTTATVTMVASAAATYYNINTGYYEIAVDIEATTSGITGNIGQGNITRFSGISNIDSVTNTSATTGGTDEETDSAFRSRGLNALLGNHVGTKGGYSRNVLTNNDVDDAKVVTAQDVNEDRSRVLDGGADVWIKTDNTSEATDSYTYPADEVVHYFDNLPVLSVSSVREGSTLLIEGQDYELVLDEQAYRRSQYSQDRIRWITTRTVGATLTVVYQYSALVNTLQSFIDSDENHVVGADVLVKVAYEAPVSITLSISLLSGYSSTLVISAVDEAIVDYLEGLTLGENVVQSDIVAIVEATSGVDSVNLPFTLFQIERPSGIVDDADENEGVSLGTTTGNLFVPSLQYASTGIITLTAG